MIKFLKEIEKTIGQKNLNSLIKEADKKVGKVLEMSPVNEYGEPRYFQKNELIPDFIRMSRIFEEKNLQISPMDVVNIFYRCKLFFAVNDEREYSRRNGCSSYKNEVDFSIPWSKKNESQDALIDEYFDRLRGLITQRTLIVEVNSIHNPSSKTQIFFNNLFEKLELPFIAYIDNEILVEKHKELEPRLNEYTFEKAQKFFHSPSIGCQVEGSYIYSTFQATNLLRTFLSLFKISGFLNPGQIDYNQRGIEIDAPVSTVFLGSHSIGGSCFGEDKKDPWLRTPDGCLWRSFGYRSLSKMRIDEKTEKQIEDFLFENKSILHVKKNQWKNMYIHDATTTLELLSSATQMPDIGAKVLQIYCCLEHLFVPKDIVTDNKKYIIGGLNALQPGLRSWFNRLHKLRCDYAHNGFIMRDEKVLNLIMESMRNIILLLRIKLSVSNTNITY
jgi:hypothetical protein